MTSEELEKRNIEKMGENFGRQYSLLNREVTILHAYWKEYQALFGTNQKRIDRLNQAAPLFFSMLQNELLQTNMLHIARLTDPPNSGVGKENLTVQNLPGLVSDAGFKMTLTDLLSVAVEKTQYCRDWRNRLFAHQDLALAMGVEKVAALEATNKEKFKEALKSIADVMNSIEQHYFNGGTSFDDVAVHNGAETLLTVLGDGLKQRARREKMIADGKLNDLDLPEQI